MSGTLSRTTRVAVIRGGPSSEHEVSLNTGKAIIAQLDRICSVTDIVIDEDGRWYRDGSARTPERALRGIDCVVNALHGEYGEDGKIQRFLERQGVPFTGSRAMPSALAMNKARAGEILERNGIPVPRYHRVHRDTWSTNVLHGIFQEVMLPCVIKPTALGSSVAVTIAHSYHELRDGIERVFEVSPKALVQEYIEGVEATCGVINAYRGEALYTLPVVEIRPQASNFFDFTAKYDGTTDEIVPGNFTEEESRQMQDMARRAHQVLHLRHYSRTDFIVTKNRNIYALEVNTLPGLTKQSLFSKSIEAVGGSFDEFLRHTVELALTH